MHIELKQIRSLVRDFYVSWMIGAILTSWNISLS